jgi:hypothetical protein
LNADYWPSWPKSARTPSGATLGVLHFWPPMATENGEAPCLAEIEQDLAVYAPLGRIG